MSKKQILLILSLILINMAYSYPLTVEVQLTYPNGTAKNGTFYNANFTIINSTDTIFTNISNVTTDNNGRFIRDFDIPLLNNDSLSAQWIIDNESTDWKTIGYTPYAINSQLLQGKGLNDLVPYINATSNIHLNNKNFTGVDNMQSNLYKIANIILYNDNNLGGTIFYNNTLGNWLGFSYETDFTMGFVNLSQTEMLANQYYRMLRFVNTGGRKYITMQGNPIDFGNNMGTGTIHYNNSGWYFINYLGDIRTYKDLNETYNLAFNQTFVPYSGANNNISANSASLVWLKNTRGIETISSSSYFFDILNNGQYIFRDSSDNSMLTINNDNISMNVEKFKLTGNITNPNGDIYTEDVTHLLNGYLNQGCTVQGNGDLYCYDAIVAGLPYENLTAMGLEESWGDLVLYGGDISCSGEYPFGSQSKESCYFTLFANTTENQSATMGFHRDFTFALNKEQGVGGDFAFFGATQFRVPSTVINFSNSSVWVYGNTSIEDVLNVSGNAIFMKNISVANGSINTTEGIKNGIWIGSLHIFESAIPADDSYTIQGINTGTNPHVLNINNRIVAPYSLSMEESILSIGFWGAGMNISWNDAIPRAEFKSTDIVPSGIYFESDTTMDINASKRTRVYGNFSVLKPDATEFVKMDTLNSTVGIGTFYTNPTSMLHVKGDVNISSSVETIFSIDNTTDSSFMVLKSGYVGIGMTPTMALDVSGRGSFTTNNMTNTLQLISTNSISQAYNMLTTSNTIDWTGTASITKVTRNINLGMTDQRQITGGTNDFAFGGLFSINRNGNFNSYANTAHTINPLYAGLTDAGHYNGTGTQSVEASGLKNVISQSYNTSSTFTYNTYGVKNEFSGTPIENAGTLTQNLYGIHSSGTGNTVGTSSYYSSYDTTSGYDSDMGLYITGKSEGNYLANDLMIGTTTTRGNGNDLTVDDYIFANNINSTNNVYFNITKEIEINPSRFKLPGVNPPEDIIIGLTPVLAYDKNTNESAYTSLHVIPDYSPGTGWEISIYWSPNDAGDAGAVKWCAKIDKSTSENDELINEAGTEYCVVDNAQSTQYELLKSSNILIPEGVVAEDDEVSFSIYRGADDPVDNYDDDALLVEATIYYTSYRMGED